MKPHELDFVTKSMEDVMKGLQALRAPKGATGPAVIGNGSNGVQMKFGSPELLQVLPHSFDGSVESSPALRGRGIPSFISMFDGESSRTFVSWLYEVECFFSDACCSETLKFDLVLPRLKGFALLWYNTLKLSRMVDEKGSISKWCELKFYMKQNFLSSSTLDKLWNELRTLKQRSLSVDEYASVFEELHFVCDANVDCVQKGVRFYHGLKSEIAQHIDLDMKYQFDDMYELALCIEKSMANTINNENLLQEHTIRCVGADENENEIYVESLAKDDVVDVGLMSFVNGFDYEVSLTQGVTFGDHEAVLGTVKHQKQHYETDFLDMGCSSSYLVSQNIKSHTYNLNECLLGLETTQGGLNMTKGNFGAVLHQASSEIGALSSHFPWECWSTKRYIGAIDGANSTKGMQHQGNHICFNLGLKSFVLVVMLLKPRFFLVVFDPGGFELSSTRLLSRTISN